MGNDTQTAIEQLASTNNRIVDLQSERDKSARAVVDMKGTISDRLSKAATGDRAYTDIEYAKDRDALSKFEIALDKADGLILSLRDALPEMEAHALAEELATLEAKCRETCSVVSDEFQAFGNTLISLAQAFDSGLEAANKAHSIAVRDHTTLSKRAAEAQGIPIANRVQLPPGVERSLYSNRELQARSVIDAVKKFSSMIKRGNLASADRLEKHESHHPLGAVAAP